MNPIEEYKKVKPDKQLMEYFHNREVPKRDPITQYQQDGEFGYGGSPTQKWIAEPSGTIHLGVLTSHVNGIRCVCGTINPCDRGLSPRYCRSCGKPL